MRLCSGDNLLEFWCRYNISIIHELIISHDLLCAFNSQARVTCSTFDLPLKSSTVEGNNFRQVYYYHLFVGSGSVSIHFQRGDTNPTKVNLVHGFLYTNSFIRLQL